MGLFLKSGSQSGTSSYTGLTHLSQLWLFTIAYAIHFICNQYSLF